ncbi:MAG: hypothetical protein ABIH42_08545 [Planctomycetota bacterium]
MDVYEETKTLQDAINKTGGSFKLSVLIQKRLKQIQRSGDMSESGTVRPDSKDVMGKIKEEILSGKIELVPEEVYRESLRDAVSRSESEKKDSKTKQE